MKKLFTLLAAIVTAIAAFAAGNTMNYQAVLRNADGTVAADKNIGIRFRILDAASAQLFSEALTVKTNDRGMVDCAIGATADNGLGDIDFRADNLRLEVAIDINGGTDYSAVYTSEIRSVAKALYATHSGDTQELRYRLDENTAMLQNDIHALQAYAEDLRAQSAEMNMRLEDQFARIYELQTYVNDLRLRTDEANARITDLENKVAELQARNADLQDLVNYLRNEVELLKSKLP